MKKGTRLLLLTAAAAVFIAGAAVLKSVIGGPAEKPVVLSLDQDSLAGIAYTCRGETLRFEKLGGRWRYADDTGFPLEESLVTAMADALAKVTASRKVSDSLDRAEAYGLKEPAVTVTAELAGGAKAVLYLGDRDGATGDTYAYAQGSQTVYAMGPSFVSKFSRPLFGLITDEPFPAIEASSIGKIAFNSGAKSLTLIRGPQGGGSSPSSPNAWFGREVDGTEKPLDLKKVNAYLESLTSTALTGTVDYSVTEEELGFWGLAAPSAVIAVDRAASPAETAAEPLRLILYLGGRAENGSYYLRHSASSRVFSISADTYAKLTGLSVESLLPSQSAQPADEPARQGS